MNFPCKCRRIPERIPNLVDRERLVCALENPGIFIRLCMPPLLADVLIARDQGFTMKKNRLIDGGFFMKKIAATLFCFWAFACSGVMAAEILIPMHLVNDKGVGEKIGHVIVTESTQGIMLKPDLRDLPPGAHGFHLHQNGSCEPAEKEGQSVAAGAAGSHYDPQDSKKHGAPWGDGHKGDLPSLNVAPNGTTTQPLMAPRLNLAELPSRALVIHAGGDNYADYPEPLGGGGDRIACGVIPEPRDMGE
jgi:Cu-Zn family superoxide dismutase